MDLSAALGSVSEQDRADMLKILEEMQVKESVQMYNSLVERCYASCVTSFRGKTLEAKEDTCMKRCAEKFIKVSRRIGQRFQEHTAGQSQPLPQ